jgi:hypothetical protein
VVHDARPKGMREREFVGFVSADPIDRQVVAARPDATAGRVSQDDELGLTVFEDVIPLHLLALINRVVDAQRERWSSADGGSELELAQAFGRMLRRIERFRRIEQGACAAITTYPSQPIPTPDSSHALRCVNRDMSWLSHLRHHDSHLLTLLIPLQLASGAQNGDLLLYRRRRQSVSLLSNLLYKTWLVIQQNRGLAVRRRQTYRDIERQRCRRIACKPGNVYVFNGFVSLHANLEIDFGERRSLIIHHFDPRLTVGVKHVTRALRKLRVRFGDLS